MKAMYEYINSVVNSCSLCGIGSVLHLTVVESPWPPTITPFHGFCDRIDISCSLLTKFIKRISNIVRKLLRTLPIRPERTVKCNGPATQRESERATKLRGEQHFLIDKKLVSLHFAGNEVHFVTCHKLTLACVHSSPSYKYTSNIVFIANVNAKEENL